MAAWRGSGGERRPDARAGSRRRGRMAGWREGHMCSSYSRRGSSRALESGGAITFPFSSSASCDFLPIPPDSHVAFLAHPFPFPPRPRFLVFCLYPDADAPSSTLPPPLVAQILDLSGLLPPDVRARRRALNARVVPVALLLLLLRAHLTQARATASARNR